MSFCTKVSYLLRCFIYLYTWQREFNKLVWLWVDNKTSWERQCLKIVLASGLFHSLSHLHSYFESPLYARNYARLYGYSDSFEKLSEPGGFKGWCSLCGYYHSNQASNSYVRHLLESSWWGHDVVSQYLQSKYTWRGSRWTLYVSRRRN